MLETGVYRGRSAAVLALSRKANEHLFLCDPTISSVELPIGIKAVDADMTGIVFWTTKSAAIPGRADYPERRHTMRWVHIDGEHSAQAVYTDLTIADHLLASMGVVSMDDFFSERYPQITAATYDYLARNPHSFRLLLVAFNKAYLCRPDAYERYQNALVSAVLKGMEQRGAKVALWKTSGQSDSPTFGMVADGGEGRLRGFDNAMNKLELIRTFNIKSNE